MQDREERTTLHRSPDGRVMAKSDEYRQLLVADLAVVMGLAPARDVAAALQRYWDESAERSLRLAEEIGRIAGLDHEAVRQLEAAAEDLVLQAGGDARRAIGLRGGIDGSIHVELSQLASSLPSAVTQAGVDVRAPLRTVDPDRYGDVTPIGAGGMGIVYRALDTELNRYVALKVVRPGRTEGTLDAEEDPLALTPPDPGSTASPAYDELYSRFLQEAWVTGALEHPGIVPVYEIGKTPAQLPFYTMRLIKGDRTLETAIASGGLEDRLQLVTAFLSVCEAVRYAHSRGVVHRDLKPANVALGEFGEVVVLDWGLAKMHDRPDLANSSWRDRIREYREAADLRTMASVLGTPGYLAPEALRGAGGDEQSDVYSLGAILFRVLTGRLPFELTSLPEFLRQLSTEVPPRADEVAKDAPPALADACVSALEPDPARRFQSVSELEEAVRAWQREAAVEREVTALLDEAERGADAFGDLGGEALLAQVDRVSALSTRALGLRPDHPRGREIAERCGSARESAIRARVRASRRRLLWRGTAATLLVLTAAAIAAAILVEGRRREAEAARERAVRAESHMARALRSARALALASASATEQATDQMLSLLLAREAARTEIRAETVSRLHRALHDGLERALIPVGRGVFTAEISPDGRFVLTAAAERRACLWTIDGTLVTEYPGHGGWVRSARFGPDAQTVLTASSDRTARLWTIEGKLQATLEGHTDYVYDAVFSPDGQQILTRSRDGTARLWTVGGAPAAVLEAGGGFLDIACFSPDGTLVLVVPEEGLATLWDAEGHKIADFADYPGGVGAAAFSPDSSQILTTHWEGKADIWDRSGALIRNLLDGEGRLRAATYTNEGRGILVNISPGGVREYDLEGRVVRQFDPPPRKSPDVLTESPSRDWVVGTGYARVVWNWASDGRLVSVCRGHQDDIWNVAFTPDESRVFSWSWDGTVRFWALRAAEVATLHSHAPWIQTVKFSPNGKHLVSACRDCVGRIWRLDGTEIARLDVEGLDDKTRWVDFSPRGERVVTASDDGTIRVWDLSGRALAVLGGEVRDVAFTYFSPDGERILAQDVDGGVEIWDVEGTRLVALQTGGTGIGGGWSPSGRRFVTASEGGEAHIRDARGEVLATLRGQGGDLRYACFDAAEERVVTASEDGTVRIYDLTGRELAAMDEHSDTVFQATFSPDGRLVVTASADATARVWDPERKTVTVLRGHADDVLSAVFSKNGDAVLTASQDGTARVFDLDGQERFTLDAHRSSVWSAAYSPSGRYIVTSSADGTAKVWLSRPEDLLDLTNERVTRDFRPEERRQYADLLGAPQSSADEASR